MSSPCGVDYRQLTVYTKYFTPPAALVLDPKIMEHAPVVGFAEIEVDVVGAVLLPRYPGLHGPQFALYEKAFARSVGLLQQRIEFGNIPIFRIATLDDHCRYPKRGKWNILNKILRSITHQEWSTYCRG